MFVKTCTTVASTCRTTNSRRPALSFGSTPMASSPTTAAARRHCCANKPHGPRSRTPRGSPCCRISIHAAPRAAPPWPASITGCSSASPAIRRLCCARESPCPPGKRPIWRPVASRRADGEAPVTAVHERPTVVVVGGGLSGLSAAVTAADAGWSVTVLEARARLGGATHSFTRAFDGGDLIVDNGQHVFLRCCTAYRGFLRRLGVEDQTSLQPRLDVPVVDPRTGQRARLRRDRLPAPLHLSRALLTYRLLSPMRRLRAVGAALALNRVDRDSPASEAQTFGAWLTTHGQSDEAIEHLFDVFTVATLNAPASQVSLSLAAMVFQDGLLRHHSACDIGVATVPLGQLHGDAAAAALAAHDIRLHSIVRTVTPLPGDRWQVDTDTASFAVYAVVFALSSDVPAGRLSACS